MRAETSVEARLENLQGIRAFIAEACRGAGADRSACRDLQLAVDEACTNIIEHGYAGAGAGSIAVTFESGGDRLAVTIVDRGRPFSPERVPPPDLTSGWRERREGGLGWHLIRHVVDEVDYRPDSVGGNRLTLVKRPGPKSLLESRAEGAAPMEITVERREHVTVVAIAGSVDGATAPTLVASFREQVGGGFVHIVGDFSRVEYTSSAGLRALLETVKETRQRGGDLRLAAVQPDVLRVLDLAGFTNILKLYGDIEEAVASFPG